MKKEELILSLDGNSHYKQMALELAEKKEDLEFVVKFVKKEQSSLKYKASKIIRLISEEHPEVLKPHMDEILSWIHHQNSFIKWDGIFVMANLAGYVEQENQLSYVEAYLSLLEDPQMITAGNAAGSAWKIVHDCLNMKESSQKSFFQYLRSSMFTRESPHRNAMPLYVGRCWSVLRSIMTSRRIRKKY